MRGTATMTVKVTEELVARLPWDKLADLDRGLSGDVRARFERWVEAREERERREAWDRELAAIEQEDDVPPASRPVFFGGMKGWAAEEFAQYEALQYDRAVIATNGQLLSERGRRAGIDSRSLFRGPVARVIAYGSDELCSFFGQHGRLGFRAFRWTLFHWPSDRRAYEYATTQDFGHVAQIEQPSW